MVFGAFLGPLVHENRWWSPLFGGIGIKARVLLLDGDLGAKKYIFVPIWICSCLKTEGGLRYAARAPEKPGYWF